MFNQLFVLKETVERHQNAPLLHERLKYLQYWSKNGAKKRTLIQIADYLIVIIDYLDLTNNKIISMSEIKKAAKKWGRRPYTYHDNEKNFLKSSESRFICSATQWLTMLNRLKCVAKKVNPFAKQIDQYINYMREERGFSEVTIKRRFHHLNDFLKYIDKANITLKKLDIITIDNILIKKREINKYSRCTIQTYAYLVRAFLFYAEQFGWCQKGLAKSIKVPRLYKEENIPYSPMWDDVKNLITSTNGNDPTNIRDRAILMLLAIYGLRRSEVTKLCLEDIDWDKEIIYLKRAKNSRPQVVPLSQPAGAAILRYLKEVRPNQCLLREIFITRIAPHKPLSNSMISTLVMNRWKPLNVKIKHHGSHSLRHACATHLINEGISLKEISDHLGHQDINSTRIYAKVNLTNLRKVCDFSIGDLL